MSNDIISRLQDKESTIRSLQQRQAKQEGQREQLIAQLKDKFGIASLEEATSLLENKQKELEANEAELTKLDAQMAGIIAEAEPKPAGGNR
jgi:predicted transcriptional regulator